MVRDDRIFQIWLSYGLLISSFKGRSISNNKGTWGPPGTDRTQVGPMLVPWTLLSGIVFSALCPSNAVWHQISCSAFVQAMAWSLMVSSHYCNQCWLENFGINPNGIWWKLADLYWQKIIIQNFGYQGFYVSARVQLVNEIFATLNVSIYSSLFLHDHESSVFIHSTRTAVMKHFSTGCSTIKRPSPSNGLFKYVSNRVISHTRCCWTQLSCILEQFIMSTIIWWIYDDEFMTWKVFRISDPLIFVLGIWGPSQ